MDDNKSPILKSAIESLDHGLEHSLKDTPKDWRFAILHVDQAVELILKEKLVLSEHSVYRRGKTLSLHETIDKLIENGIKIPERPLIEDAREIRNMTQHRGHTVTKETITYYVNIEYNFCKKFLENEMGVNISEYIKPGKKSRFEGYGTSSKKQIQSVYKQINENPEGAILGIFGALEFTSYQDFPNESLSSLILQLRDNNSISEFEHGQLLEAYKLKSKITDNLYAPTIDEAKQTVEIVSKLIKKISEMHEVNSIIDLENFPKMIDDYLNELKIRKYSTKTIDSYKYNLNNFYTFLIEQKEYNGMNVTKIFEKYKLHLKRDENVSDNYIYVISVIIKKFSEFHNIGILKNLKLPKRTKSIPKLLTEREVKKLINAIDNSKKSNILNLRNKLILTLIYSSRLKISELVLLLIEDIDLNEKKIKLTKNGKERIILFKNEIKILLEEYFQERNDNNKFLFVSNSGKQLSPRGIQIMIKEYADVAGIKKNVNATILKNSFEVHALQKGSEIITVNNIIDRQSNLKIT